jgi:hypothetical protein
MSISRYYFSRVVFLLAVAACISMSWFGSRAAGVPWYESFQMSLFQQPSVLWTLGVIGLLALLGVIVGQLIAGGIRREAGFVVGLLGLVGLSVRGGTIQSVYQAAESAAIFRALALELCLYAVLATILWIGLSWFVGSSLAPAFLRCEQASKRSPLPVVACSVLCQSVALLLMMYVLGRSGAKGQAIGSVALASLVSTMAVRGLFPLPNSAIYWPAPLLVGVIGYLANGFDPSGLETARLSGNFASLGQALPLDYLAVGPAAAVIGYWLSQDWTGAAEPKKKNIVKAPPKSDGA